MCAVAHSYTSAHDPEICATWIIHIRCWPYCPDDLPPPKLCGTGLSHMCDMTHSYTSALDSDICATWLIHVRHDSFMCDMMDSHTSLALLHRCLASSKLHIRSLSPTCDMTHSHTSAHDFSHMCDMTHPNCALDHSVLRVTWLIHIRRRMTSVICATWLIQTAH